jgi:hypothetical protein
MRANVTNRAASASFPTTVQSRSTWPERSASSRWRRAFCRRSRGSRSRMPPVLSPSPAGPWQPRRSIREASAGAGDEEAGSHALPAPLDRNHRPPFLPASPASDPHLEIEHLGLRAEPAAGLGHLNSRAGLRRALTPPASRPCADLRACGRDLPGSTRARAGGWYLVRLARR